MFFGGGERQDFELLARECCHNKLLPLRTLTVTTFFFADDPHTKATIAKRKTTKPQLRPDTILRVLNKSEDPPSSEWVDWTGPLDPGHFFADDLAQVTMELPAQAICPKVQPSG